MLLFFLRRLGVTILTAFCLTFIVFVVTNMQPNLEKIAKNQGNARMTDAEVTSWLSDRGYDRNVFNKYGQWLGVVPGYVKTNARGRTYGRCFGASDNGVPVDAPKYCGILQGDWGKSIVFKEANWEITKRRLGMTAYLMMWVMVLMVPGALLVGVLAGMREGSRLDRSLSTFSIITTATPEYVSGVILIVVFSSSAVGLKWFKGSAARAMEEPTFENFALPVITITLYGMGYIARMTRASMVEVMTAQYIRTARLKGVSFGNIVLKHALRNALIAPFTVIMLQIPWLLNGVVIVETLFNYKGLGWVLVQAAGNNDIELLLAVSTVSVIVVITTQLISDLGYVVLNPRIRLT